MLMVLIMFTTGSAEGAPAKFGRLPAPGPGVHCALAGRAQHQPYQVSRACAFAAGLDSLALHNLHALLGCTVVHISHTLRIVVGLGCGWSPRELQPLFYLHCHTSLPAAPHSICCPPTAHLPGPGCRPSTSCSRTGSSLTPPCLTQTSRGCSG
jgi:hypothetical protein